MSADTGQIVAASLTAKETDDGAEVGPLLDQVAGPVSSFTADSAYDQEGVAAAVVERDPEAAIGRFKQVIGDGLRARTDRRRTTEVDVAVHALNRMLALGRPSSVRIA